MILYPNTVYNNNIVGIIRPKRLLVFINPVGGKKLAGKIYREKVQPLFELADINAEVIGKPLYKINI